MEGEKPETAAKLHIRKSKTEERSPIVYKCVPAIKMLLEFHPLRDDPEAPLFVNNYRNTNPISYKEARDVLLRLGERAKIAKRCNPHSFRKSACSLCGDMGMGDSQIDKRFGWSVGSRVKTAYLFPEESKANEAYLAGSGVDLKTQKKEQRKEVKPPICPWCETLNAIGRSFCANPKCRMPLDTDVRIAEDRKRVKEMIMEEMAEMISRGARTQTI